MADATVLFRSLSSQPSRRTALAQLAAGAAAVAAPTVALATEPDPHLAWFAEWQALVDWCNGPEPGDRDLQEFPQYHRTLELEDLIGTTPARTLAGASVQLRLMRYWCTPEAMPNDTLNAALDNAMATVERMAEKSAHV